MIPFCPFKSVLQFTFNRLLDSETLFDFQSNSLIIE